jgi:hypothetical protein
MAEQGQGQQHLTPEQDRRKIGALAFDTPQRAASERYAHVQVMDGCDGRVRYKEDVNSARHF